MKYQSDFEEDINPYGLVFLIGVLLFLLVRYGGLGEHLLSTVQAIFTSGLGIIGIVYTSRQSRLSRAQAEASLVIEVSAENVIRATNSNSVPIEIVSVATKMFTMNRDFATQEALLKVFNDLHGEWARKCNLGVETIYLKVHEGMRLSKDEKVTLLNHQTGLKGPIELTELNIQIISVVYRTDLDGTEYRKSVGVYRLTSPERALLWRTCQSTAIDKIDFENLRGLVEERGLIDNRGGGTFVETVRMHIDDNAVVAPTYKTTLLNELKKYDEQIEMNPDSLPQDQWIVYRIETERVNQNTNH